MASVAFLALIGMAAGQERHDVSSTTSFPGQQPTAADFYYNNRAIGRNREAFEEVIKRINVLPAGTSIVWGPNFARCDMCSSSYPACLPEHLYPEMWKRLEEISPSGK